MREIVTMKITNFLAVMSWEVHVESTCSRIRHNLFTRIINGLSKMLDMSVRRMLYYDLIYPLLPYGIVWGQNAKALARQMFVLQKRNVTYISGLKQL
jgi:hypothetical protein